MARRQYYASGAYENPQAVIDQKSGMIWANTIANFGNTAANTIREIDKQQTERQKQANDQIQWTADYFLKESGKTDSAMAQAGNNNPQLAEALKSVAITSAPVNFEGPLIIAILFFISILAPILFNSGTCINLFSKILSVILDIP